LIVAKLLFRDKSDIRKILLTKLKLFSLPDKRYHNKNHHQSQKGMSYTPAEPSISNQQIVLMAAKKTI